MHIKYLEKLKQINNNAKRERMNLKAFNHAFPNIWNLGETLKEENSIVSDIVISDYWGGTFCVYVRNLDGFKGEDFVNLLFAIEQTFAGEFTMKDFPENNEKRFYFTLPWQWGEGERQLTVRVEAGLKTDSQECRRIVIGETVETVRRPAYKLICGDEVEA